MRCYPLTKGVIKMKAKAYFEALGRSASSRGLPITETRIMRQEWPRFAREAWAAGWLMQRRH